MGKIKMVPGLYYGGKDISPGRYEISPMESENEDKPRVSLTIYPDCFSPDCFSNDCCGTRNADWEHFCFYKKSSFVVRVRESDVVDLRDDAWFEKQDETPLI